MLEVDAKLKGNFDYRNNDLSTFSIRRKPNAEKGDQLTLHFPDNAEFGILNNHASKALESLVQRPELQFEALGSIRNALEIIGRVNKATDALVRVNINVYGPKKSSKEIGRHLTEHKMYLQRPDKVRNGASYENPHVLAFSDLQISSNENQLDVGNNKTTKLDDDAQKFKETISNVYSSLTRGANLNKVEGDHRLRTELMV